jgi:PhnB protein
MQLNPYVFYDGTCEAAFRFYEQALGGKIEAMMTHRGTPAEQQVSEEWRDKIIHARMSWGDQVLLASDDPTGTYKVPQGFRISFGVDTPAEAERAFAAISKGGTVQMPMSETFFALRFGMAVDQFGIPWMIICQRPM